jgi:hypothetical protein
MPTAETISEILRVSSRCVCASCTHLWRVCVRACGPQQDATVNRLAWGEQPPRKHASSTRFTARELALSSSILNSVFAVRAFTTHHDSCTHFQLACLPSAICPHHNSFYPVEASPPSVNPSLALSEIPTLRNGVCPCRRVSVVACTGCMWPQ